MTTRHRFISLGLRSVAAMIVAYAICRAFVSFHPQLKEGVLGGSWISTAEENSYSTCLRKTVVLPSEVRNAWLAVSVCDSFELKVNGSTVCWENLWRPVRPFQYGLSEQGQNLVSMAPLFRENFPREYQWRGHKTYRVPIFADIGPFLTKGRNAICVQLESRRAPAKACIDGEILLRSGERVSLRSDPTWRANRVPVTQSDQNWTLPNFVEENWTPACSVSAPPSSLLFAFNPDVFTQPITASWLQGHSDVSGRDVWFSADWDLPAWSSDACVRLLTTRPYDLFINGRQVEAPGRLLRGLISSDYVIDQNRTSLSIPDESRDEDNSLSSMSGEPERATGGDSEVQQSEPVMSKAESLAAKSVDRHNDQDIPDIPDIPELGSLFNHPADRIPKALNRSGQLGDFDVYAVQWLLKPGHNKISIRLRSPGTGLAWSPKMAIEAVANYEDRQPANLISGVHQFVTGLSDGPRGQVAASAGPVDQPGKFLPRRVFCGTAYDQHDKLLCWGKITALLVFVFLLGGWIIDWRSHLLAAPRLSRLLKNIPAACTLFASFLFAFEMVTLSWAERDEMLCVLDGAAWQWALGGAAVLFLLVASRQPGGLLLPFRIGGMAMATGHLFGSLIGCRLWRWTLVAVLLVFCTFLRAYQIDRQPIDEDEYASLQAIQAISDVGLPRYSDDVYYSRSPIYHYLVAGVVHLFGVNLWALRLPTVVAGTATALLIYLFGSRILGSAGVGLVSLALYSIHPFAIFSSHIIRFYQQQQFFALLTVFFFIKGFVVTQEPKYRYLTVFAFLGAVLSQELSAIVGLQLAVAYVLFAENKRAAFEVKFLTVSFCVVAIIALDVAVFSTCCLTTPAGVSPHAEPKVGLGFEAPMNLLALFVGHSRAHMVLSVFLLAGAIAAWRSANRVLLSCFFFLGSGIFLTNLMVTTLGYRYQYWMLPLWLLLSVYGIKMAIHQLGGRVSRESLSGLPLEWSLGIIFCVAVVLSWSPWRIVNSYSTKLIGDSSGAFGFVRTNLRPGDAVAATEPHVDAALLETGRADYDLSVPVFYDFTFLRDGRLIDRNASAPVIKDLSALERACADHARLWVLVNRERRSPFVNDMKWELPAARLDFFLTTNLELKFETYMWSVYLWDKASGRLHDFRLDR